MFHVIIMSVIKKNSINRIDNVGVIDLVDAVKKRPRMEDKKINKASIQQN